MPNGLSKRSSRREVALVKVDEWLDEVNEQDEVIGRRRRSEIHQSNLRHRSVHLFVFDQEGRLFLQKRSHRKDVHPGLWDTSAAGHVDAGEDIGTSALRELKEELGLAPKTPLEFLLKLEAEATTGWEFISLFKTIAESPITLEAEEIDEGQWLSESAVNAWIKMGGEGLTPTFIHLWTHYRRL